jgi:hypothetical protein
MQKKSVTEQTKYCSKSWMEKPRVTSLFSLNYGFSQLHFCRSDFSRTETRKCTVISVFEVRWSSKFKLLCIDVHNGSLFYYNWPLIGSEVFWHDWQHPTNSKALYTACGQRILTKFPWQTYFVKPWCGPLPPCSSGRHDTFESGHGW